MSQSPGPGRVIQCRLALLPNGDLAEAALDADRNAWARWHDGTA